MSPASSQPNKFSKIPRPPKLMSPVFLSTLSPALLAGYIYIYVFRVFIYYSTFVLLLFWLQLSESYYGAYLLRKFLMVFLYSLEGFGLKCERFDLSNLPVLPNFGQFQSDDEELNIEILYVRQKVAAVKAERSMYRKESKKSEREGMEEEITPNVPNPMRFLPPSLPVGDIISVFRSIRPFATISSDPLLFASPSSLLLSSLHSRSVFFFIIDNVFFYLYSFLQIILL
jgi:hypothetical protein